jgi:hypothetical protein
MADTRTQEEMSREESLRLLGSVPMGRVVFTTAVDGIGTIVAFEADAIDPFNRTGWNVVVVGGARLLRDDDPQPGHNQNLLQPWAATAKDDIIVIQADTVTGIRLARTDAARS